ncbi:MAG TPA: hypothetical protein VNB90_12850 [Cytophagaceae bacterium]|nr:hypothetical protein [Cytophagaceae bacterium]
MDITKLKALEDLIAIREPLEITYNDKRIDYKNDQFDSMIASIQTQLTNASFTVVPVENGIKGTYLEATISARKNQEATDKETALIMYIDIRFRGTIIKNYQITAFEMGNVATTPDPLPPEDGQTELDIMMVREQQLIDYYQAFNAAILNPTLNYALTEKTVQPDDTDEDDDDDDDSGDSGGSGDTDDDSGSGDSGSGDDTPPPPEKIPEVQYPVFIFQQFSDLLQSLFAQ